MKPTIFINIFSAPAISVAGSVWYLITQKLAWLRRPGRVGRGGCAAALVIAGVFLVASCSPDMSSLFCWFNDDCTEPTTPPTRIALIDISASTQVAQSAYKERFKEDTREFAQAQPKSTLLVYLVAGDPLAESRNEKFTFSTVAPPGSDFAKTDLKSQAEKVNTKVDEWMDDPGITILERTSLVRAFLLVDPEVDRAKRPVDIVVYSDGVENSEDVKMLDSRQLADEATINSTLDQLQDNGLIPENLSDVPVSFPLGGYHPNGSQADPVKVKSFWQAWAKRTGANLTWG